jgi:hypothetical protein
MRFTMELLQRLSWRNLRAPMETSGRILGGRWGILGGILGVPGDSPGGILGASLEWFCG